MIKSIGILLILFFSSGYVFSQNTIGAFYKEQNKAIMEFAQSKDSAKLVKYYVECLSKYDFTMLKDISFDEGKGLEMATIIKDYKSANELFKYEISTGLVEVMFSYMQKKPHYAAYFTLAEAQQIIAEYEKYNTIYKQGIDLAYCSVISGCASTDQWARSLFGNQYSWVTGNAYKRFSFVDEKTRAQIFDSMIRVTDSLNFAILYAAVADYGFYTKSKTRGGLGFILVHLYGPGRDQLHQGISSTQFLDSIMHKAVLEGELSPYEYILMHDVPEYPYSFETKSTYGCSIRGSDGKYYIPNKIIDVENIDKRRASIYLPPLWVDALRYDFELPKGYTR